MINKSIHITIVEDDDLLKDALVNLFQKQGYVVSYFSSAEGVVEFIRNGDTDVVICDIVLPDESGLEIIKQLSDRPQVGKIIISGKTDVDDRITGLSLGVDDYICKPLDNTEILLRVQALLNRLTVQSDDNYKDDSSIINIFDLQLNLENRNLSFDHHVINLGINEFKLLSFLYSQQGKICSREKLVEALDNSDSYQSGRALDILVSRVRKKITMLTQRDSNIVTYRGQGYMLPVN
jgi:DNA-binding response OmpR family regulator